MCFWTTGEEPERVAHRAKFESLILGKDNKHFRDCLAELVSDTSLHTPKFMAWAHSVFCFLVFLVRLHPLL